MRLLFTGATGFLGSSMIPILHGKDFEITTLGQNNCDANFNLSEEIPIFKNEFDIVFHAAGKAHVIPKNQKQIDEFFEVNLQGTKNLCEGLKKSKIPKYFYFISTVAVYGKDEGVLLTEDETLNGSTPYAKSKILTEHFLIEWCKENEVILFILRPSLIAGKNAPGNLGDMTNAIKKGRYANIDGGKAEKSVILATDFVQIIDKGLKKKGGIYNVCSDEHPNFYTISKTISEKLEKKIPPNIPFIIMKFIAFFGDFLGSNFPLNTVKLEKITKSLTFSNDKIKKELDFIPTNVLENYKL